MILLTKKLRQLKRLFLRCVVSRNEIKNTKLKRKVTKTNVPEWTAKEYKHIATAEEKEKLEELRRSMLED